MSYEFGTLNRTFTDICTTFHCDLMLYVSQLAYGLVIMHLFVIGATLNDRQNDRWVMLKTAGEAGDVKTGWVRLSSSISLRNYFRRGGRASLPGDDARRARRQTDSHPPPSTFDELRHTAVVSPLAVKSR